MYSFRTFAKFIARAIFGCFSKRGYDSSKIISIPNADVFFGYFGRDIVRNNKILATVVADKSTNLSVINIDTGTVVKSFPLRTTNLQQANQQQWFDENTFGFLDLDSFNYISTKIVNNEDIAINIPLALQTKINESSFIAIDYSSFEKFAPDYSYYNGKSSVSGVHIVTFDLCAATYETARQFDSRCVKRFLKLINPEKFHLNHFLVSPCMNYILFVARYYKKGKRVDKLLMWSLSKAEFTICLGTDYVSHFCFMSKSELLIFGRPNVNDKRCYFVLDINKGITSSYLPAKELKVDGHPVSYKNTVITDTYPNIYNYQKLIVLKEKESREFNFFHPNILDPARRCDLHPVYDNSSNTVFVNHFHEKRRVIGCVSV